MNENQTKKTVKSLKLFKKLHIPLIRTLYLLCFFEAVFIVFYFTIQTYQVSPIIILLLKLLLFIPPIAFLIIIIYLLYFFNKFKSLLKKKIKSLNSKEKQEN